MLKALIVGIGGFLGAIMRYGISTTFNLYFSHFPFGTLVANVLGSFFIGFLLYSFSHGKALPEHWKAFLVAGFLGSLTTMSSFAYETYRLFDLKYLAFAVGNLVLTLLACFIAVYLGKRLAILVFWRDVMW